MPTETLLRKDTILFLLILEYYERFSIVNPVVCRLSAKYNGNVLPCQ